MGTVMAMVVFVALFNTLTMSVSERTREIGTLSALGAYPSDILAGFVREATLLALCGSLLGTLLTGITIVAVRVADIQMPPPREEPKVIRSISIFLHSGWVLHPRHSADLCTRGVVLCAQRRQ